MTTIAGRRRPRAPLVGLDEPVFMMTSSEFEVGDGLVMIEGRAGHPTNHGRRGQAQRAEARCPVAFDDGHLDVRRVEGVHGG
jgi:hypothetical protein